MIPRMPSMTKTKIPWSVETTCSILRLQTEKILKKMRVKNNRAPHTDGGIGRKTFIQKQIEHPFSLGNINIIFDKNAVYEREIVLFRVQIWLPQLVVFFLVNRTFLWLFLAVFRGGHDSPLGQGSVCIVFHRRTNNVFYRSVLVDDPKTNCFRLNSVNLSEFLIRCSAPN